MCSENTIDTAQVRTLQNIRVTHPNRRICSKKKKDAVQMACPIWRVVIIFKKELNRELPNGVCNVCAYCCRRIASHNQLYRIIIAEATRFVKKCITIPGHFKRGRISLRQQLDSSQGSAIMKGTVNREITILVWSSDALEVVGCFSVSVLGD